MANMEKPQPDPATVAAIVRLCVGKCFDWAQGAIPETLAAVAAQLPEKAVAIKHEMMTVNPMMFLLWDDSRAEHGEGPTLLDVYATRELAEGQIERTRSADPDYAEALEIEEREVNHGVG